MFCRWIALLLLCWLPVQGAYALASSYCAHEVGAATHIGHHEHQHADARTAGDAGSANLGGADNDCAQCHLTCACALPCQAGPGSITPPQGAPVAFDAPPTWHHPDPLERVPLIRPLTLA